MPMIVDHILLCTSTSVNILIVDFICIISSMIVIIDDYKQCYYNDIVIMVLLTSASMTVDFKSYYVHLYSRAKCTTTDWNNCSRLGSPIWQQTNFTKRC